MTNVTKWDNVVNMENNIKKAFEELYSRKAEMEKFMDFYVFKRMKVDKNTFLNDKNDFLLFIKFCLNTAQKKSDKNLKDGLSYFKSKYSYIIKLLNNKDIDKLKRCIYESPGVGQKIGSMILEFVYLYSDKRDDVIAKELFLPLDTHVLHLLDECFHLNNIPKEHQFKIENANFIKFQKSLQNYTNGKPIIYFDYLWFIGKIFCNKINENAEKSRGYKLCNYCWIQKYCENEDKWI